MAHVGWVGSESLDIAQHLVGNSANVEHMLLEPLNAEMR